MENLVKSIEASERLGYDVLNPEKIHEYWLRAANKQTGLGVTYEELKMVIDGDFESLGDDRLRLLDYFLPNYVVYCEAQLDKQIPFIRQLIANVAWENGDQEPQSAYNDLIGRMKLLGATEYLFQLIEAFRDLLESNNFFPGAKDVSTYFVELDGLLMRYLSMESERSIMRPLIEQTQKALDVYFQRKSVGSKVAEVLGMK